MWVQETAKEGVGSGEERAGGRGQLCERPGDHAELLGSGFGLR